MVAAQSPDRDGRPDPSTAGTATEFVDALRRLKSWVGMGLRRLESRAASVGQVLPRSTVAAALKRDALPREDLLVAFVRTCGGDEREVDRWVSARRRIATGMSPFAPLSIPPSAPPTVEVLATASVPEPVRCTLPADQAVFVGRDKELEQITIAVADAAQRGGVVAIHAIDGMPGIGKTALAVHVAHQLTDRFADRQLFINLHAHTPGQAPVQPSDALAQLLAADGMDPRFLPDTVDGRAALWRDRMAGKQLLLVLDNAAGSEQVAPLLPGSPGSLVLITSRRSLGDMTSALPVPLDMLTEDEAITMFVRLAPRAGDRQAVIELVRICGYLPLAISIMASVYRRHRSWSIGDVVREAHRSDGGPLTLTAENRTVAAVFDMSYQHLPTGRQRLFRLLAGHPGVDIDPYAAAALAGISVDEAQRHLDGLHADHLLEEPVYRRYRMHDLIRTYALNLAITVDPVAMRLEAAGRLLDFYRHTAARAMDLAYSYEQLRPAVPSAGTSMPVLADSNQADRWLDTELANLLAAAHHAAEHGWPEHIWHLSAILDRHLQTRGRYRDAQKLHQQALDLAGPLSNHPAQMHALNGLGYVHWMLGRNEQAGDHYSRALKAAQALGEPVGESNALNGLGQVCWTLGRYEQAVDHFERALRIAEAIGDRVGESNVPTGLGGGRWWLERFEQAVDQYGQALRIARATGGRNGEVNAPTGFDDVRWRLNRFEQAVGHYRRALRIAQATGDRHSEAGALHGLRYVHWKLGRYEQAGGNFGWAARIAQALGDRVGEINALTGLGHFQRMLGRHSQAADCYQQVLALAKELKSSNWQYEALQGTGRLHHATGQPDLALACHEQALQLATDLNQQANQARAHDGLAHAHHAKGQHEQARQRWQLALNILTSLGTDLTDDIEANAPNIRAHLANTMPSDQNPPPAQQPIQQRRTSGPSTNGSGNTEDRLIRSRV